MVCTSLSFFFACVINFCWDEIFITHIHTAAATTCYHTTTITTTIIEDVLITDLAYVLGRM